MNEKSSYLLGLALFVPTLLLLTAIRGGVVVAYWTWFVVPLGAPGLSLWHAVGLAGLVTTVTYDSSITRNKPDPDTSGLHDLGMLFLKSIGYSILFYVTGAAYHYAMVTWP